MDIHLGIGGHVRNLEGLIESRAIVLYFKPFERLSLQRMGTAFGWTVEETEARVVGLIQAGELNGRVDSKGKILEARKRDERGELFARAIKAGVEIQAMNKKLLLRMRL